MIRDFKVIFFDAGGTLLHPYPSVGVIYQQVSARFGCRASSEGIQRRFMECWKKSEGISKLTNHCTEKIEKEWWKALVWEVFSVFEGIRDFDAFFEELYHVFAGPEVWRLYPETEKVLKALKSEGKKLAIISNWDSRLFKLCELLNLDQYFEFILASAVFGASKPSMRIFEEALRRTGIPASESVHIGDSYEDDVKGAMSAGLQAILLDRHDHHEGSLLPMKPFSTIQNLGQLIEG